MYERAGNCLATLDDVKNPKTRNAVFAGNKLNARRFRHFIKTSRAVVRERKFRAFGLRPGAFFIVVRPGALVL